MKVTERIALSGIMAALYIAVVFATAGFSFGQYQIRIATALYALAFHFPFLVLPLALANMLSNLLMGGLGLLDVAGGFVIGLITSGSIVCMKRFTKRAALLVLPIALAPSLIVPLWLNAILNVPYWTLASSLFVGQAISAYTLGMYIIKSDWIERFFQRNSGKRP